MLTGTTAHAKMTKHNIIKHLCEHIEMKTTMSMCPENFWKHSLIIRKQIVIDNDAASTHANYDKT